MMSTGVHAGVTAVGPSAAAGGGGDAAAAAGAFAKKPPLSKAERRARAMRRVPRHKINLRHARYCVMARCAAALKWPVEMSAVPSRRCTMRWMDRWGAGDFVRPGPLKQNHFAGMRELCTKCGLARCLNRIKALFPEEYTFYPRTWVLPGDRADLVAFWTVHTARARRRRARARQRKKRAAAAAAAGGGAAGGGAGGGADDEDEPGGQEGGDEGEEVEASDGDSDAPPARPGAAAATAPRRRGGGGCASLPTLICKPDGGCQGRGIFLTTDVSAIDEDASCVVQLYVARPLLINGHKFDLRIYVCVTSAYPELRVYIHREGLVRFCTAEYQPPSRKNMDNAFMHLSNYAINKHNDAFERFGDGDDGAVPPPLPAAVATAVEAGAEGGGGDSDSEPDAPEDPALAGAGTPWRAGIGAGAPPRGSRGPYVTGVPLRGSSRFTEATGSDSGLAPEDPRDVEEMLYDVSGSKWSLTAFFAYLAARRECDVPRLWEDIRGVVARTLLSVRGRLMHEYAAARADCLDDGFMCFEVLGFDVLLDAACVLRAREHAVLRLCVCVRAARARARGSPSLCVRACCARASTRFSVSVCACVRGCARVGDPPPHTPVRRRRRYRFAFPHHCRRPQVHADCAGGEPDTLFPLRLRARRVHQGPGARVCGRMRECIRECGSARACAGRRAGDGDGRRVPRAPHRIGRGAQAATRALRPRRAERRRDGDGGGRRRGGARGGGGAPGGGRRRRRRAGDGFEVRAPCPPPPHGWASRACVGRARAAARAARLAALREEYEALHAGGYERVLPPLPGDPAAEALRAIGGSTPGAGRDKAPRRARPQAEATPPAPVRPRAPSRLTPRAASGVASGGGEGGMHNRMGGGGGGAAAARRPVRRTLSAAAAAEASRAAAAGAGGGGDAVVSPSGRDAGAPPPPMAEEARRGVVFERLSRPPQRPVGGAVLAARARAGTVGLEAAAAAAVSQGIRYAPGAGAAVAVEALDSAAAARVVAALGGGGGDGGMHNRMGGGGGDRGSVRRASMTARAAVAAATAAATAATAVAAATAAAALDAWRGKAVARVGAPAPVDARAAFAVGGRVSPITAAPRYALDGGGGAGTRGDSGDGGMHNRMGGDSGLHVEAAAPRYSSLPRVHSPLVLRARAAVPTPVEGRIHGRVGAGGGGAAAAPDRAGVQDGRRRLG